jgi:hypothetical protein
MTKAIRRLGRLAAVMALLGAGEALSVPSAHAAGGCDPVWTDASGDAYQYLPFQGLPVYVATYQPQLDLASGTVWQSGSNLVVRTHVADMEPTKLPIGREAQSWDVWLSVAGVTVEVEATASLEGTAYWFYSTATGTRRAAGTTVTGVDGYVEVDVPLADAGSPPAGTTVTVTSVRAWEWLAGVTLDTPALPDLSPFVTGVPTEFTVGVLGVPDDDAPGGGSTVVGATCP